MKPLPKSISQIPTSEPPPKRLVLYVEDDEKNRAIALLHLKKNFKLLLASSAREACEILVNHGTQIEAILMDIELKDSPFDGITLTKLIRGTLSTQNLPDWARQVPVLKTPILFVTAFADQYAETKLIRAGGNRVIRKPVDFVQLSMALTRIRLERDTQEMVKRISTIPPTYE